MTIFLILPLAQLSEWSATCNEAVPAKPHMCMQGLKRCLSFPVWLSLAHPTAIRKVLSCRHDQSAPQVATEQTSCIGAIVGCGLRGIQETDDKMNDFVASWEVLLSPST